MRSPVWAFGLLLMLPSFSNVPFGGRSQQSAPTPIVRARAAKTSPIVPGRNAMTVTSPARVLPAAHVANAGLCGSLARPDDDGHSLARADVITSFVDGRDLLARVNRSAAGALAPDFAPDDLVDLRTGEPSDALACEPPGGQCLRRDAANALHEMFDAMRSAGHEAHVHSAFRAYAAQCGVFAKWAYQNGQGFCAATEQSALAGHSQHQLGTALDLFTRAWADAGPVFRNGFGCSPGGSWLASHAWEHGFVLPYPLAPQFRAPGSECAVRDGVHTTIDPRTGYRYEPWHLRYVGRENAARFHAAWLASGPGTDSEITLDEWLRREARVPGDVDLPVCDACACGACTTLSRDGRGPCGDRALRIDAEGAPRLDAQAPELREVSFVSNTVVVRVHVPVGTVTQTSSEASAPNDDLPGAYRIAFEFDASTTHWPVRLALSSEASLVPWRGVRAYVPAQAGDIVLRRELPTAANGRDVRVVLWRDGTPLASHNSPSPGSAASALPAAQPAFEPAARAHTGP